MKSTKRGGRRAVVIPSRKFRPGARRIVSIVHWLQEGPQSIARLAVELEVCEQTVKRDLDFARDVLGLPISSKAPGEPTPRTHLTGPVRLCPACLRQVNEGQGGAR
jgi:hypothetical protein